MTVIQAAAKHDKHELNNGLGLQKNNKDGQKLKSTGIIL